jgi:hypothetical protein
MGFRSGPLRVELPADDTTSAQGHAVSRPLAHPWVTSGQQQVRFGIGGGPFAGDWPVLRDFVQTVEGLGFDSY